MTEHECDYCHESEEAERLRLGTADELERLRQMRYDLEALVKGQEEYQTADHAAWLRAIKAILT